MNTTVSAAIPLPQRDPPVPMSVKSVTPRRSPRPARINVSAQNPVPGIRSTGNVRYAAKISPPVKAHFPLHRQTLWRSLRSRCQEMIDDLPTAEELQAMTKEEQQEVYADLQAAYDAYEALTDGQKAEVTGAGILKACLVCSME